MPVIEQPLEGFSVAIQGNLVEKNAHHDMVMLAGDQAGPEASQVGGYSKMLNAFLNQHAAQIGRERIISEDDRKMCRFDNHALLVLQGGCQMSGAKDSKRCVSSP